jgi:hypothetical protein
MYRGFEDTFCFSFLFGTCKQHIIAKSRYVCTECHIRQHIIAKSRYVCTERHIRECGDFHILYEPV